jgi:DNA-binding XRE family transcriptional regulator
LTEPIIAALIAERKRRGWSCGDIARKIGVSRQAVNYWESGQTDPRLICLYRWADVLDFDLALFRRRR